MPKIIAGNCHKDHRGLLFFNNDFDMTNIKRMYVIENNSIHLIRGWQGHKIEQRWFSAIIGSFNIQLIKIDNWEKPTLTLPKLFITLDSKHLDILHIPSGYISSIQAIEKDSKLLVFSDYHLSEINDDFRFSTEYFSIK